MNARNISLFAGFFLILLATFIQGLLPMLQPESNQTKVTKVVRTDLGELKWMVSEATDYTEKEAMGRKVYIREGCWYCHSQYVRPVTGETRRWGPITQAGEYAFDLPHLFSTRRIGPDLSRVGLKYSDEWHLAHFWSPRTIVPDSIMPRFSALFDGPYKQVRVVKDKEDQRSLEKTEVTQALFDFDSKEKILLTPNTEGLLFVPERGKYPVIFTPNDEFTGDTVTLVARTDELDNLIIYLQKLGMNRGKWRDLFAPQRMEASQVSLLKSAEWIEYGKEVYERRCMGCHGQDGDGNGLAATFMYKARPRPFTFGVYKFRLTPSGALPTDGDLLRTISRGVRGTAMPPFHNLMEKDRLAVIQYVRYVLSADRSDPDNVYLYFEEEDPEPPIFITRPPVPSEDMLVDGKEVWQLAKCWECHGDNGKGDGTKSARLKDDFGYPIPPADLTTGLFKSGPGVKDIFRTISTGLNGTPMPSYSDTFSEDEIWSLSYFVLSLSAYTDSLTGQSLPISAEDRSALNDPELKASESSDSYAPTPSVVTEEQGTYGGAAWAEKHGIEVDVKSAYNMPQDSPDKAGSSREM